MSGPIDRSPDEGGNWFAVRCVFQCGREASTTYEERITLWRGSGFDEAIALAEAEAEEYAEQVESRYLGLAQAYHLADEVGHGAEVYSLIRDSDMPPSEYLTAFFDTGSECQTRSDEDPVQQPKP